MTIVLAFFRSIFLLSIGFYIYYISRRKRHDVVIQMWLTVIIGMLSSLAIQAINLYLGNSVWESMQISFILLTVIVFYSFWKLLIELRKRHWKKS